MAHPKRKISRTRRDKRRTHDFCTPKTTAECSNCGNIVQYHRVCTECGHYRGRQVVEVEVTA